MTAPVVATVACEHCQRLVRPAVHLCGAAPIPCAGCSALPDRARLYPLRQHPHVSATTGQRFCGRCRARGAGGAT